VIILFEIELWNNKLKFTTENTLFSPTGPDRGTLAMLKNVSLDEVEKVLDLGCGYGLVGVSIAKVIGADRVAMTDVDIRATETAAINARDNGVADIKVFHGNALEKLEDRDYTLILSNPPYHTDFSIPKQFIEDGFRHLAVGGRMVMVVKRLDWYKNKLTTIFGGVRVVEEDGYYILTAQKRNLKVIKDKEKKTTKKHEKLQSLKKRK
jgi:16S rRNA (guanine1207-N2)-methyltransferase